MSFFKLNRKYLENVQGKISSLRIAGWKRNGNIYSTVYSFTKDHGFSVECYVAETPSFFQFASHSFNDGV